MRPRALLELAFVTAAILFEQFAYAQPPTPKPGQDLDRLGVHPGRVVPGEAMIVSGEFCAAESPVNIDVYAPDLVATKTAKSDERGDFEKQITIPKQTKPGRAWIRSGCEGFSGDQIVAQAVVVVVRPAFVVTWVNLTFGAGSFLLVMGFGMIARRQTGHGKRRRRGKRRRGYG